MIKVISDSKQKLESLKYSRKKVSCKCSVSEFENTLKKILIIGMA